MTRHGHLLAALGLVACLGLAAVDAHAGPRHRRFFAGPSVHGHVHAYGGWGYAPRHPYTRFGTVWRHHGLGEGGYCHADGVRSFHGLGDGYCYEPGPARYWWLETAPPPPPAPRYAPPPEPPASQPHPGATAPPAVEETSFTRTSRAWSLLERGDARAARRDFAVLALRTPEDTTPRVGFALASAMLGENETAIWSMRRAFEIDAAAVADLAVDGALARRLQSLIARYEAIAREPGSGTEAIFMAAALHLLSGADERAASAITEAIEKGDREPATLALRDLIEGSNPRREDKAPGECFVEAGDLDV
jgi:hypothetical protein